MERQGRRSETPLFRWEESAGEAESQPEGTRGWSRGGRRLAWAIRIALLLLIVAAPWPFGSATHRPMGLLTAALYVLFGAWAAYLLVSKNRPGFEWPAARWVALGLVFGLFQLVPLPGGLLSILSPASHDIWYPDVSEAREVLGDGWRPISVEPFSTQAELLRFGSLAAAFFLAAQLFARRREIRLFAYTVTVLGVALSFFAVYQQARWGALLYGRFPVPSATPFGPFVNHNHFAGFIELCALVTLGAAIGHLGRKSPAASILLGGSAAVMGIALVLSRSRGGLIAAAAGAIMLGILILRGGSRARSVTLGVWAGAVALIILLAAPQSVFDRISTISSPGQDVSVNFRLDLWRDSLRLVARSPFAGTGIGTYQAAIPPYRTDNDETRAEHAESDLMEHTCEAGLLGVLILGGFIVFVARRARNLSISNEGITRTHGIQMGVAAATFALLVHSAFDFNTRIPSNALLLAASLGLLAGAHAGKNPPVRLRLPRRLLPAVLVVVLAFGAAWRCSTIGLSRHITRRVNTTLAEPEDFGQIAAQLSGAEKLAASNPEIPFKRGRLYNEEAYRSVDAARYRDLRFTQARASFERAVRSAPARGPHWFELAWTEGNMRNDAAADTLFELALKLEPQWSRLRANYALYLASRGRVEEALNELERARQLRPGLSAYESVSVIAPYVNDDAAILRRAAGAGVDANEVVSRYLTQNGKR